MLSTDCQSIDSNNVECGGAMGQDRAGGGQAIGRKRRALCSSRAGSGSEPGDSIGRVSDHGLATHDDEEVFRERHVFEMA